MYCVLCEALANCLVNADFYTSRGIVIKKSVHEIVMENPGIIRIGKAQMLKGGISDPRNKALMKMFNLIGIGERARSGVPDIFDVWHKAGLYPPIIEEQFEPDRTVLTLPIQYADKSADKIRNRHKQVLELMETGIEYRAEDIAQRVGLGLTRTKVLLRQLCDLNVIEKLWENRNRRYRRLN